MQGQTRPCYCHNFFPSLFLEAHSRSKSADGPHVQSGFSPARHLRHTTAPYNRPNEVQVDAVLSMVTPIGLQMEYDRERVSGVCYYKQKGLKKIGKGLSEGKG